MNFRTTFPKKNNWQIDFLPCLSITRVDYTTDEDYQKDIEEGLYDRIEDYKPLTKYYSICFQWLFWSLNWHINY